MVHEEEGQRDEDAAAVVSDQVVPEEVARKVLEVGQVGQVVADVSKADEDCRQVHQQQRILDDAEVKQEHAGD